jgi:hypothetical protein
MAYFSLNEDFQRLGSSCGGQCQCGPCRQSHSGRAALAEWYERDEDEPEPPRTAAKAPPRPAIGEPPPTLRPPSQPTPPPRPPDLFKLSPELQRQLIEKWERERRDRGMFGPLPAPPQPMTLQEAIDRFLNNNLNRLMGDLRIPPPLRDPIRNAARAAIGRGAEELLDRSLMQMGLSGEAKEAIGASVRAAMRQIRVR